MIKRKFVFAHIKVATEYAKLSSCQRMKVGAVIVKEDTPIAIGYNGTKPGQDNCCEGADGKTLPTVRHAEINALNKLWTTANTAKGAVIFQTHEPCLECAQDLFNAGITEVYYRWDYRVHDGVEFLLKKKIPVYKIIPDLYLIKRVSLMYTTRGGELTYDLAYDTIDETKEINEEAARAAGLVEWDYFEIREPAPVQLEEGFIPFDGSVELKEFAQHPFPQPTILPAKPSDRDSWFDDQVRSDGSGWDYSVR